ncbi:GNAT family N-acetyltransferase [Natrialba sp. INN-245]|uniref:GNAT family N-acetyltransferase n=1 Tax=Natrialba sp. INN-245 TaxID=2690967 RepID=UPI0013128C28|nr:GNAT family N-acetyltransferase [Natrialba sp. INN-245]MWV41382.1 GNAT family N-acetyltransferase [Natrialba sp. INN-245]
MTPTIEAFPGESADLADGARLYRDAFNEPPWDDEWTLETARTRLSQLLETPGARGYAARLEDDLAGLVVGTEEWWDDGSKFYVRELCVDPAHQRRGVATALMDHLAEALRRAGVDSIYLLTLRDTPAHAFYEKRGFDLDDRTVLLSRRLDR